MWNLANQLESREEHALPSALIAEERLKDKISNEDISVIKTIIEFHEVPRDHPSIEEIFRKIAMKNNIQEDKLPRVRKMAEILKDADALDRTRFINTARLNPNYLKFDYSKQLVRLSSSIQETYALEDLKEYQTNEEISTLLEEFTPQEVLRIIRQSTKGFKSIEDIQTFIKLWAESKKSKELKEMFNEEKPKEEQSIYEK